MAKRVAKKRRARRTAQPSLDGRNFLLILTLAALALAVILIQNIWW